MPVASFESLVSGLRELIGPNAPEVSVGGGPAAAGAVTQGAALLMNLDASSSNQRPFQVGADAVG